MTHTPCNQRGGGKRQSSIDKKLVARAELYMGFDWLDTWLHELKSMNAGKVGEPYLYPESMIRFLAMLRAKGFSLRELQGVLHGLKRRLGPFPVISYSQISRRIGALDLTFDPLPEGGVVAIDGSGFKVTNRGEWIRHKWCVKRGWVKVVIMGTPDGDIIDILVGDENLDERAAARELITKHRPDKALLDGLHDVNKTYQLCDELGVQLCVPCRKGANGSGLSYRAKSVREQHTLGYDVWKRKHGFGQRWPAAEGIFSADKRLFGEGLQNHRSENIFHEAKLKFWAYKRLKRAEATA